MSAQEEPGIGLELYNEQWRAQCSSQAARGRQPANDLLALVLPLPRSVTSGKAMNQMLWG